MKRSATGIILMSLVLAVGARAVSFATNVEQTGTIVVTDEGNANNVTVGSGIDSITGEVKGPCIVHAGNEQLPTPTVPIGRFHAELTNSIDKFLESQKVDVVGSMHYSGVFSGQNASHYLTSSEVSSYATNLTILMKVKSEPQLLQNYTLTGPAQEACNNGTFRKECGDELVRGLVRGGGFEAVFSASSSTTNQNKEVSDNLNVVATAINTQASLSADYLNTLNRWRNEGRLNVDYLWKGILHGLPQLNPDDIVRYALHPENIQEPIVVEYILYPYWQSQCSDIKREMANEQVDYFNVVDKYLLNLYKSLNEYRYISDHLEDFALDSSNSVDKVISKISDEIKRVETRNSACLKDKNECAVSGQEIQLETLPKQPYFWEVLNPAANSPDLEKTKISAVATNDPSILELTGFVVRAGNRISISSLGDNLRILCIDARTHDQHKYRIVAGYKDRMSVPAGKDVYVWLNYTHPYIDEFAHDESDPLRGRLYPTRSIAGEDRPATLVEACVPN
jgi:hypothetical protein